MSARLPSALLLLAVALAIATAYARPIVDVRQGGRSARRHSTVAAPASLGACRDLATSAGQMFLGEAVAIPIDRRFAGLPVLAFTSRVLSPSTTSTRRSAVGALPPRQSPVLRT